VHPAQFPAASAEEALTSDSGDADRRALPGPGDGRHAGPLEISRRANHPQTIRIPTVAR